VTAGNGIGESDWISRTFRTIEQSTQRATTEFDLRQSLRDWDRSHPQIHHELIVRYVFGAIVSGVITSIYNGITRRPSNNNSGYHR
jgi:hypothetical protein